MRPAYLLDTTHMSQLPLPQSPVRGAVKLRRADGIVIGTCVPVLCEVEAGIHGLRDPDAYRQNLSRVLRHVRVWPMDPRTAHEYGRIVVELRARGRVLSQVDMMLAALARQMRLVLVTSDHDFEGLPDLRTENGTASS